MIRNYLVSALRNLRKTAGFSAINILGLSSGIAACLLILHYVHFENSFDNYHPNGDRIYRIRYERHSNNGTSVRFASCSPPTAPILKERIPEIEIIARIFRYKATALNGDIKFSEERMFFAEEDFLKIFQLNFVKGNPATALSNANTAIISQSTAKKYFPGEDPMGKLISVDKKIDFIITGIFEDSPPNTHLKMDILLSYPTITTLYAPDVLGSWGHTGFFTYALVSKNTTPAILKEKLAAVVHDVLGDAFKSYDLTVVLEPQLMRDIHLTSHYLQEFEANGDKTSVLFMTIIAFVIIIIAWVNYINLSTARAIKRAKEVGLRKVVGAGKKQLIGQFFIETTLLNILGFTVGLLIIAAAFPHFCRLSGLTTAVSIWHSGFFYQEIICLFLSSILLSGIYPILVQTSFKPIAVIRGIFGTSTKGVGFRKALVLFQFSIAFILLVATLTIFKQIKFMRDQTLGFDIDQIVVLKAPRIQGENFEKRFESFKDELRRYPNIADIAFSREVPGRQIYWDNGGIFPAGSDVSKSKNYMIMGIGYEFLDMYDIKFLAGRNFSKEFSTDPDGLILNETALQWLEFESPENAIGKQISYWGKIYTVIGVVADYHHESPKAAFEPTIFRFLTNSPRGMYSIKIKSANFSATLKQIETVYKKSFPDNPFTFFFLDEYFNEQYFADKQFGAVFRTFTGLALLVTCLGIFGLAAFNASQRRKEIGIRKVLGASVSTIVILLVKDLFYLVFTSTVLMIPVSFFGIRNWLQGFNSRMEIGIFLFVIPLIILVVITGLTVVFQSIKAALANPVESIKYE